jgi:hypothetical protein
MWSIAVEINVDQDSCHGRSKVVEIPDEGKNCAHLASTLAGHHAGGSARCAVGWCSK